MDWKNATRTFLFTQYESCCGSISEGPRAREAEIKIHMIAAEMFLLHMSACWFRAT